MPILHGLCTYGVTARAIYESFHKDDPQKLKEWTVRFTSHVFPGETLVVEMWKESDQIIVNTKTKERGKVALVGYCKLRNEVQAKL